MSNIEDKTIPCKTCGKLTNKLGSKLCNGCWEVESRIEDYLKSNKAKMLIAEKLPCYYPKFVVLKMSKAIDLYKLKSEIDFLLEVNSERAEPFIWMDLNQILLEVEK